MHESYVYELTLMKFAFYLFYFTDSTRKKQQRTRFV